MSGGNGKKPERMTEQNIPVNLSILKADPSAIFMKRIVGRGKIDSESYELFFVETSPPSFMVEFRADRYLMSSFDLIKAVIVLAERKKRGLK